MDEMKFEYGMEFQEEMEFVIDEMKCKMNVISMMKTPLIEITN